MIVADAAASPCQHRSFSMGAEFVVDELIVIHGRNRGLCVALVRFGWPDWRHQPIEKITIEHLYL
ncbi:MAG: hypothetical protein KGL35_02230 [Bradyrhizobium sp.]|nr:hypothetical protein [Pseudomonadota bacterium]MDE2467577.1 hypothetical protein [Bradyrhizobium sp.]